MSSTFLVNKTVQNYPIRQQLNYYEDIQQQNLTLYINKKVADIKLSNGINTMSAKDLIKLNIQTGSESPRIERKRKNIKQEIINQMPNSYKKHKIKQNIKPDQKVASLLHDELIKQNSTYSLYQQYKMANLKANLQKIQAQKKCNLLELNHIELNDDEQINYYLLEMQKHHPEMNPAKILEVKVNTIQTINNNDKLNEIIEKRINKEELEQLMSKDERKQFVEIYKKSRYDQFEPEYNKKNKLKMTTFKKQKEIQDQLFQQIIDNQLQNNTNQKQDQTKFIRTQQKYFSSGKKFNSISKPISQRQSIYINDTRPQTAQLTQSQTFLTSSKKNLDIKRNDIQSQQQFQDLIGYCIDIENEQQHLNKQIKRKFKKLDQEIKRSVRTVSESLRNQDQQNLLNQDFEKFQSETQFKRKLIGFLMNQIPDKTEVLSQKARKETTKQFFDKIKDIS